MTAIPRDVCSAFAADATVRIATESIIEYFIENGIEVTKRLVRWTEAKSGADRCGIANTVH